MNLSEDAKLYLFLAAFFGTLVAAILGAGVWSENKIAARRAAACAAGDEEACRPPRTTICTQYGHTLVCQEVP